MPFGLRYLALPPRAPLLFPLFPRSHYASYCLIPLFPNPLSHLPFPQITSTPQFPPLEAVATSVLPFAVLLFRLPLLHSPPFVIFPLSLCLRPFHLLSLPCSLILFLLTLTHHRHFLPLHPLLPLPLVLSVRQSLTYISPFPSDLFLPRKLNWTTIFLVLFSRFVVFPVQKQSVYPLYLLNLPQLILLPPLSSPLTFSI